jgi:hypothetical protein
MGNISIGLASQAATIANGVVFCGSHNEITTLQIIRQRIGFFPERMCRSLSIRLREVRKILIVVRYLRRSVAGLAGLTKLGETPPAQVRP